MPPSLLQIVWEASRETKDISPCLWTQAEVHDAVPVIAAAVELCACVKPMGISGNSRYLCGVAAVEV